MAGRGTPPRDRGAGSPAPLRPGDEVLVTTPRGKVWAVVVELDRWGIYPVARVKEKRTGRASWVPVGNCERRPD